MNMMRWRYQLCVYGNGALRDLSGLSGCAHNRCVTSACVGSRWHGTQLEHVEETEPNTRLVCVVRQNLLAGFER